MITRILCTFLFLLPSLAYAKINVAVSITPVASLIAMVAGDKAEVSVIAKTEDCPHHYALKPSDLKSAERADLFVYIDDEFDAFAKLLLAKSNAKIFKISETPGLRLIPHNWHLWLLPENAQVILESAEKMLSEILPENESFFKSNLKRSLEQIKGLEKRRQGIINSDTRFILLTDSAEYLFMDTKSSVVKLYMHSDYSSLKMLNRLKDTDNTACYVISLEQDLGKFRHLLGAQAQIIQLATENWGESRDLENLYYKEYEAILFSLSKLKSLQICNY